MILENERNEVVKYCKKLISHHLTKGTGGNISIFDRKTGYIAISPSGVDYEVMTAEDVVVVDPDGNIVDGRLKPSSEMDLHLRCYAAREDFSAIVHTHSTYAATIACTGADLPPIHYLVALSGCDHVPCIPYYPFGSRQLADAAAGKMKEISGLNAVLLGNHGMVTGGKNINNAFVAAEELEFVSELYYRASLLGNVQLLSSEDIDIVARNMNNYGQKVE